MKVKTEDLIFISKIRRDGSGTDPVTYIPKEDSFHVVCLSITNETYIAHGFNSYIVKLKK